jgi:hypothetical protein
MSPLSRQGRLKLAVSAPSGFRNKEGEKRGYQVSQPFEAVEKVAPAWKGRWSEQYSSRIAPPVATPHAKQLPASNHITSEVAALPARRVFQQSRLVVTPGASWPLAPHFGRSLDRHAFPKPAVKPLVQFPFSHVRPAISGKSNREQISGKRNPEETRSACINGLVLFDLPNRERWISAHS